MERTAPAKPKKGTAKRARIRGKRREGVVAKSVRQQCVERDGSCALGRYDYSLQALRLLDWPCAGPSEWAHIGQHRRCHTRGMTPEARHTTQGSAMMCQRHHRAYDAHEFEIEPLDERGMDGPFGVIVRAK